MSRTAVYTGLVLRCRSSGESNNEVTLLTAEEGIIKATVFGGAKSKLRAHCAPYNSGQIWIYRDKAKDLTHNFNHAKLSDFDVRSWRPGLRELYDRTMTAAAVADTINSSHGGGGEWGTALRLAAQTLDALENANEELCSCLLIHFLWRWAHFLGIQPNIEICADCENKLNEKVIYYSANDGTAVCSDCSPQSSNSIKLNPGCRKWLSAVEKIEAPQLHRYSMDSKSSEEAKALVTSVLTGVIGKRLASWEW